jgi:hypothetical protein
MHPVRWGVIERHTDWPAVAHCQPAQPITPPEWLGVHSVHLDRGLPLPLLYQTLARGGQRRRKLYPPGGGRHHRYHDSLRRHPHALGLDFDALRRREIDLPNRRRQKQVALEVGGHLLGQGLGPSLEPEFLGVDVERLGPARRVQIEEVPQ